MKLHHVAKVSTSLENADLFYEGILGLRKIKVSKLTEDLSKQIFGVARECRMILYGNGTLAIEVFVLGFDPGKGPPFVHICLEVEDREEFLGRCQTAGLVVNRVLKGDSLVIFIEDYDGNLFEVKESAT